MIRVGSAEVYMKKAYYGRATIDASLLYIHHRARRSVNGQVAFWRHDKDHKESHSSLKKVANRGSTPVNHQRRIVGRAEIR